MKSNLISIFFLFSLFISSWSCSDKKGIVDVIDIFPTDSLSTFVGLPTQVNYYDDKLFAVEALGQDGFVKVIDVINDSLLFSFVKRGKGPNECLSVSSIDIYDYDNYGTVVGIYDFNSSVYQVYSYSELFNMKDLAQPILRKQFPDSRFCSFLRLDSMYLATDLSGEKRFVLYDKSFNNGKSVVDYRPKPSEAFPDEIHALLHNGKTFISRDRKTIGNTIFLTPLLSVFTVENQTIQSAWDYIIQEMNYTIDGGDYNIKTPKGYLSGAFSKKYVYGLFCGKEDNEGDYADEIHVFSYDGKLLKKYRLALPAFDICIDEVKNNFYVLVHEPEPKIFIYHLNDI